jgi:magnesium transporter
MTLRVRKPPVGASPGTLVIDPEALPSSVWVFSYDKDTLEEYKSISVEEIEELRTGGRKLWVDVQGLGDERLMRQLAESFSIHPLALEDVVHVRVRPKAERYEQNLLIVTRMLRQGDGDPLDVEQVSLLIGKDYVLTFQETYGDVLDPVRHRLKIHHSRIRSHSSDYLGYVILDTIIDAYYPVVERVGDQIEILEERVLSESSPETLRELNSMKTQLMKLRRAIMPQREAVNALKLGEHELVSENVRIHLRDTHDHIVQLAEAVEQARELVNGLMNTYLTVVSNRMNEVMKTLTIVASIFVPLTFMAGVYGMNFTNMPELEVSWAYPLLLSAMVFVAIGMVAYFWRKGWIGRR